MNGQSVLPLALVGVLAGAAGGAVGALATRGAASPAGSASASRPAPDLDVDLDERFDSLDRRLDALERRRAAERTLAAHASAMAADDPPPAGGGAAVPFDGGTSSPAFVAAVRSAVDQIEWEREEERRVRRTERGQQRVETFLTTLEQRVALRPDQKEKVRKILEDRAAEMERMWSERRSGGPAGDAGAGFGDRRRTLRDQTEKQLGEVLDESQMKAYREVQSESRWGRGGGRGAGRGNAPE
ncbi:MAG: hypothetical protein IT376_00795 [Polyangiaceae bacterium]|nr:hypothetical protein [Polyangiaceae bacterium]